MPLGVGSAYTTVGARFDDTGFDAFDRRLARTKAITKDGVAVPLTGDVDDRSFKRYDDHLHRAEQGTDRATRKMRDSFGMVGKIAGGVVIGEVLNQGVRGFFEFAKAGIDAASDVNESLSKNRVLFGRYAKDIEAFASTSAEKFGIARSAALEYTGVFGNLARAVGLGRKQSAGLSTDLTKLAADMASFSNTSIDEALESLRSGLVGETEPLRKYGVTLSATAVQAEAVNMGLLKVDKTSTIYKESALKVAQAVQKQTDALKESGRNSLEYQDATIDVEKAQANLVKTSKGANSELTAQQKALATVSVITKQTKNAQGDFARTSDGAANQSRILTARIADMREELGEKLLPVQADVVRWLNRMLTGWQDNTGAGGELRRTVEQIADVLGDLLEVGKDVGGWLKDHIGLVKAAVSAWAAYRTAVILAAAATKAGGLMGRGRAAIAAPAAGAAASAAGGAVGRGAAARVAGAAGGVTGGLAIYAALDTFSKFNNGPDVGLLQEVVGKFDTAAEGVAKLRARIDELVDTGDKGGMRKLAGQLRDLAAANGDLTRGEHLKKFASDLDDLADHGGADVRRLEKEQREVTRNMRHNWRELRDRTDVELKDVRDMVRSSARMIRERLGEDTEAGKKAAVQNFKEARRGIRDSMRDGTIDVKEGTRAIRDLMVKELKVYGLSANQARNYIKSDTGDYRGSNHAGAGAGHAVGGIPNPGASSRDDHLLLDPSGRPVAMMSGSEGILNRPQMGEVDRALAITNALGLGSYGSLGDLWNSGMRHYAGGGQIVPVPGFPGEQANRSILDEIAATVRRFPGLVLTDAYGSGHKSPGHTVTGTAADFSGPDRVMDAAVKALVRAGYLVGYDGRFGSQNWPGHGPSTRTPNYHLHVEFGSGGRGLTLEQIKAPRTRESGLLGGITQGALNLVTAGANTAVGRAVSSALATPMAGGHAAGAGADVVAAFRRAIRSTGANRTEQLALWEAGIVESGLRNLSFGDADSLGALQERVSIYGRSHALDPFASAVRFLRDAIGRRPWRSSAGLLAAAVQRPAAAYVGRYDQVAGQARRYLGGGGRFRGNKAGAVGVLKPNGKAHGNATPKIGKVGGKRRGIPGGIPIPAAQPNGAEAWESYQATIAAQVRAGILDQGAANDLLTRYGTGILNDPTPGAWAPLGYLDRLDIMGDLRELAAVDTGPSPDAIADAQAIADQANRRTNDALADLAAARRNLAAFSGPGDLGVGGVNAFGAMLNSGTAGLGIGSAGLVGGTNGINVIQIAMSSFVPPSGTDAQRMAAAVASSLDAQPYRTATKETVS